MQCRYCSIEIPIAEIDREDLLEYHRLAKDAAKERVATPNFLRCQSCLRVEREFLKTEADLFERGKAALLDEIEQQRQAYVEGRLTAQAKQRRSSEKRRAA